MPFPVIPLPLAFTLPDIAGVPDVLGRVVPPQITAVISTSLASVYDAWLLQDEKKKWGFFEVISETIPPAYAKGELSGTIPLGDVLKPTVVNSTNPVLTSASVHSIELQESYAISTAPQEDGAFTSYNKVKLPTTGAVRLICDGFQTGASLLVEALGQSRAIWDANVKPKAIKETFLNTLADMASNTKLYQLVTPEKTWDRVNIIGYHISRSVEQPHTMLFVDVRFVEVRSANVETRKATKKPNGAAKVDNGVTTPIPVAS
ncbi:hypothetical protein CGLAMM_02775 [Acetobacteraceae bacterium EV16G]|uniref:Dit-like phage tail protein N-terminal domain-containing protein n=1 Tax=Sorlinia euscelidii TaxID=3081148 RepID=A0ABU7U1B8_9PROT